MEDVVGRPTRAARVGEWVMLEPGGVEVDPSTGRYLASDGSRGRLTAIERNLLVALLAHRGEVVSRDKLFAATHGGALADPGGLRAVDQAVSRLRRRLFGKHDGLVAVRGLGYRLVGALVEAKAASSTLIGRESELALLESTLALHRRPPLRVELVGAAGIGKTSLAREVWRRAVERGEQACWVDFGAVRDVTEALTTVAAGLQVVVGSGRDWAALLDAVEARLGASLKLSRPLVILDDAEDGGPALVELLARCPSLAQARLVVAARRSIQTPAALSLALRGLDVPASIELLRRRGFEAHPAAPDELARLDAIARQLVGWPLALELAAARLREAPEGERAVRLEEIVAEGERAIEAVLSDMWSGLTTNERQMLCALALAGDMPLLAERGAESAAESRAAELQRLGWLGARRADGRLELHRIVRELVLQRITDDDRAAFVVLLRGHAERLWALPLNNDPRVAAELAGLAHVFAVGRSMARDVDDRALFTLVLGRHFLLAGPRERAMAVADELLAEGAAVGVARRRQLHGLRAWLLGATEGGDGGAADASAALDLSSTDDERAEALTLLARTHRERPAIAEAALREALDLRAHPLERAMAEAVLASFMTREERYDEALAPMTRAFDALEALSVETRYAQQNYLAVILAECGARLQARRMFEAAEAAYARLGRGGPVRPGFHATRALLALDAGDGPAAEKLLARVVDSADRAGRPGLAATASMWLPVAALLGGDRDGARRYLLALTAPERGGREHALRSGDRGFYRALRALLGPHDDDLAAARALVGGRYPATSYFIAEVANALGDPAPLTRFERPPTGLRARLAARLVSAARA